MQAKGNFVILEKDDTENTSGGIILQASSKPQNIGKIVSVGECVKTVEIGDRVVFNSLQGKFPMNGVEYFVVLDTNIMAVL